MKLKRGTFSNFGSYKFFDFDFENLGLSLLYGPTGAGKSTILDMVAWTLFGVTAKDGAVDEVRSWFAEEATQGDIEVELQDGTIIEVTRIRGTASENDLFWTEGESKDSKRGKDLADTQRLLEQRMGITADEYLTGAYFHEFSLTASFFTAKARDRRDVFEKIAPVGLADKLSERASEARKVSSKVLAEKTRAFERASGRYTQLLSSLQQTHKAQTSYVEKKEALIAEYKAKSEAFDIVRADKIKALILKAESFDTVHQANIDKEVAKLEKLEQSMRDASYFDERIENAKKLGACVTCKQPLKEYQDKIDKLRQEKAENQRMADKFENGREALRALVQDTINVHWEAVEEAKKEVNTFEALIAAQQEDLKNNPYIEQAKQQERELGDLKGAVSALQIEVIGLEDEISKLKVLQDLAPVLRGELLQQSIKQIETSTNRYLEKYFDSEIRVEFILDADNLEVGIQKSGYDCVYRQLSKGQRGLLKLCFSVSIMEAAANKAGVHFDCLFFDEALDGLDSDLKVKAFGLFEELSTAHSSILLIDHAQEFQNLFANKFRVMMTGDTSEIEVVESEQQAIA